MTNAHEHMDALISMQEADDFYELYSKQSKEQDNFFGAHSISQDYDWRNKLPDSQKNKGGVKKTSSLLDEPISKKLFKSLFPPQWIRNYLEADQMMAEGYEKYGPMSETLPYFIKGIQSDKNIKTALEPFKQMLGMHPATKPLKMALDPRVKSVVQEHVKKLTTTK